MVGLRVCAGTIDMRRRFPALPRRATILIPLKSPIQRWKTLTSGTAASHLPAGAARLFSLSRVVLEHVRDYLSLHENPFLSCQPARRFSIRRTRRTALCLRCLADERDLVSKANPDR